MSAPYPPPPWDLTGRGWITAWSLRGPLPGMPDGVRPVGRLALTMFVDYRPPGQMAYSELLAGVVVRQGRRVGLAITDIWVDSPASRYGGRELWGVPKELAAFRIDDDAATGLHADRDGVALAEARFRPGRVPGVPLPLRAPAAIAQSMPLAADGTAALPGARTVWTPVAARARSVRPARATWSAPADGPLGWLAGARPRGSVVVDGFAMRFGR